MKYIIPLFLVAGCECIQPASQSHLNYQPSESQPVISAPIETAPPEEEPEKHEEYEKP